MRSLLAVLLLGCFTCSANADVFPPEQRFAVMLADGNRLFADRPQDWADETVQPKLAGQLVFDPNRPFRWLIDQAVPLGRPPKSFVEFIGGDCLPGQVVDYEPAATDAFENPGEYLIVEPTISIDLPNVPPSGFVRVTTEWLRRIVWERVPGTPLEYRPGTAFLRDGSQVKFKSIRWSKGAIAVLTDDGIRTLLLAQVAELHLPQRSAWDVWFEQLGLLSPDLTARLVQIETADGLRLTASTQRYRPQHHGDRNKPEDWYPLFQPAWSLDPVVVPFRVIRSWRFFAPVEPPATLFEPQGTRANPVLSSGWNWRLDRCVQDESLRVNKLLFGWGFGVHAPTELDLALHPCVTGFRVLTGLDHVIGRGGCARSAIAYSNNVASPLYRSDLLMGTEKLVDVGWINVAPPADPGVTLKLVADPAIADRPAGADPFDIRDCLDWLEPQWRLDPNRLRDEVVARQPRRIPALKDWLISGQLASGKDEAQAPASNSPQKPIVRLTNVWDNLVPEDARFRLDFEPAERFVVLSRQIEVSDTCRWLGLSITRQAGQTTPVRVHVRANGVALGEVLVPERANRAEPDPILFPLSSVRGKSVELTVVLIADGDKSRVDWRGARLLNHHPGLVRIFDDEPAFLEHLTDGEGGVSLTTSEKQLGAAALKLTIGERGQPRIPGVDYAIRETPRVGEFRFLRFSWKKAGGDQIGLQLGHDGVLGVEFDDQGGKKKPQAVLASTLRSRRGLPKDNRGAQFGYQYDIGKDNPLQPVLRLDKKISGNWEAHTRDLFAELGTFQLTGLGFQCPDGEAAYFDGLYLARSQQDFQWASEWTEIIAPASPADPNIIARAAQPWEYGVILAKAMSVFSLDANGGELWLLKDAHGRQAVRTYPVAQNKPCILRTPLSVAAGKKTLLKVTCGRHPQGDWQLAVLADGQELLRTMIDANTAKDGWIDQEVDLSRFASKNIVLELHNHPNNWQNEDGYWGAVTIVEQ